MLNVIKRVQLQRGCNLPTTVQYRQRTGVYNVTIAFLQRVSIALAMQSAVLAMIDSV